MDKHVISRLSSVLCAVLAGGAPAGELEPVDAANPLVGTDNTGEVSNGNLYPAIARPWGMNAWTPQTREAGQGWLYDWKDRKFCGFHQTHQPSPWIGDYAQFSVMPMAGRIGFSERERASWFSHKTEKANPSYYRVYLADDDLTAELAPTERAAMLRLTYPKTDAPRFLVDALKGDARIDVDAAARRVTGYSTLLNVRGSEKNIELPIVKTWFVLAFDRDIVSVRTNGNRTLLTFAPTRKGERVHVKMASSFIGTEQARRNLRELGDDGFDAVVARGRAAWNDALGRIAVSGGTEENRRKFYTCLYRALLFPRQTHEYDERGEPVHFSFYGKGVVPGRYYCDTGFWDTFRALFPLLTFVYPERTREMMEGLVHCLDESGWLPEWSAPFHRNCMIGQNSASVVADAWFGGCMDRETALTLYGGLLKSANAVHATVPSVGRLGFDEYNALGFVARDGKTKRRSASRTLEYAYADWCIWKLGCALGRPESETSVYLKRSANWRNVFHPERKLACGRAKDGSWDPDLNPVRWDYDFTEGTPLHYTWSVFHDIPGLIDAIGGREAFIAKLDGVFDMPPTFDGSYFGGCTHEIREMQIAGFGQYAHGNQPIQHMIYLYSHAGRRDKAAYWARQVMDRLYTTRPDGYCGDEDNGQTSAWFVWSAMGLYPVCPVSGDYALGGGLFDRVVVTRSDGARITFDADGRINGARPRSDIVSRDALLARSERLGSWRGDGAPKRFLGIGRIKSPTEQKSRVLAMKNERD